MPRRPLGGRTPRWRPGRSTSAGQVAVSLVAAVVAVAGSVAALLGAGSPARAVPLRDGAAWVQSQVKGSLQRLDTGSGAVGYSLGTPIAQVPLEIVEDGLSTMVRDPASGQVRSIDLSGAKARLSDPVTLPGAARLVAGGRRTFVVHPGDGTVATLEPGKLVIGEAARLGGPIGATVVDDDGVLWAVMEGTGRVVPVSAEGSRVSVGAAAQAAAAGTALDLTVANGRTFCLDRTTGAISRLEPGRATVVSTVPARAIVAPYQGDAADGTLVVLDPAATIIRVDPATGQQVRYELRDRLGGRLGPPVQGAVRIGVADYATGEMVVIDPVSRSSEVRMVRSTPGPFPILAPDGALVANDPASQTAIVVTPAGSTETVDKYGDAPSDDLRQPAPQPPVAPAPAAQPTAGPRPVPAPTPAVAPAPATRAPVAPGSVSGLVAIAGNARIDLTWRLGPDGGSPLVGHEVVCRPASGGKVILATAAGGATTTAVAGAVNGTAYACSVAARSAVGLGPVATAPPVTPLADVPSPPSAVTGTAGDGQVRVAWQPSAAGGAVPQRYVVSLVAPTGATTAEVAASQNQVVASRLVNGVAYKVTVRAVGANGGASAAAEAGAPVTPAGPPGAPQAVALDTRSRTIVARWQPAEPSGSPVTGYRVKVEPGGGSAQVGGNVLTATIKDLANGPAYRVTVVATNAVGPGPPSEPKLATLTGPLIRDLKAVPEGSRAVRVTYAVDWNGESPGQCVASVGGASKGGPCGEPILVGGLDHGTTYDASIKASYGGGGEASKGGVRVTTAAPPTAQVSRWMRDTMARDWWYGTNLAGKPATHGVCQSANFSVYSERQPGAVELIRYVNGTERWYGRADESPPSGYRNDGVIGWVMTAPGPGLDPVHRATRSTDDLFLPASYDIAYVQARTGGWTDRGVLFYAPWQDALC